MNKQGKEAGIPRGKGEGEGDEEKEEAEEGEAGIVPATSRRGGSRAGQRGWRGRKGGQLGFLQKTLPRWAQRSTRTVCTGAKAPREHSCARHGATVRGKERRKEKGRKRRERR